MPYDIYGSGAESQMGGAMAAQAAVLGRDGRAMAEQIGALRAHLGRMNPAQIYEAACLLHSEARARGLAVLESLAGRMALQIGPRGGRGAVIAYLDVMAQAVQMPSDDRDEASVEPWLALAALRLGN